MAYNKSDYKEKKLFVFAAGLIWGISYYTYALSYVSTTLFHLAALTYLLFLKKVNLKNLALFCIPVVFMGMPLAIMVLRNKAGMPELLVGPFTIPRLGSFRGSEITASNILENMVITLKVIMTRDRLDYNAFDIYYTMYPISIPFAVIGFITVSAECVRSIRKRYYSIWCIFWFLFLSNLAVSLLLGGNGPDSFENFIFTLPKQINEDACYIVKETNESYIQKLEKNLFFHVKGMASLFFIINTKRKNEKKHIYLKIRGEIMKKKNAVFLIIIFLEILVLVITAVKPIKEQSYSWGQDQLSVVNENRERTSGFCLNQPEETGDSEYIVSETFSLKKGRYTVRVKYDSVGGGKIRALCTDGRYRDDLAGNLLLKEDLQEMSFAIDVNDPKRELEIRGFQRLDRGDTDYLLIREISVQTSANEKFLRLVMLFGIFLFLDLAVWAFSSARVRDKIRNNALLIAVFSIAVFLTSLPLFVSYLPSEMLDIRFHITRIEGLREGLLNGSFPVRIQPGWLNEHGYAASVFYGDLFLYFPAVLSILGVPLQTAYQCFVLAVNIATIWIAFYCCKKMTGNRNVAMFAAVLYTGNLYRITALYMRAAVGAYCAMIFFPLIVLGLWEIFKQDNDKGKLEKGWQPLVIGFSGILEAHIISFEMTAVFTALLCLILWKKTFQKNRFWALCKVVVVTILANLWFLVPFLDYLRDDFQINSKGAYVGDHYKLQERGLFLPQIFSSDFEVVSASKDISTGIQGEMPLTIGMALTMVLAAGILLWAYKIQKKEKWREFVLCLCMTLLSFALTLSCFPYIQIGRIMPYFQMAFRSIQYSWRFLTISTALLLWMFCLFGMEMEKHSRKLFGYAAAMMCAICLFQAVDFSSDVLNDMGNMKVYSGANLDMNDIGGGEYLPLNTDMEALRNRIDSTEAVEVEEWDRKYNSISCSLKNRSEQSEKLELPLLFYRYYRADAGMETLEVGRAESGRLAVTVPASFEGNITVYFKEPVIWRVAELISLLTFLCLISAGKRKRREGDFRN